jgi:hypothetical protein
MHQLNDDKKQQKKSGSSTVGFFFVHYFNSVDLLSTILLIAPVVG